ncbi:Major cell-surface adhesin PAc [Actinoplanes sp. SE50]|uniref:hypothetical protein n=1 Tax=unclassified Actinoplanes TaxID=2626549 RepID=UPI00023ECA9D|nr:MULTISPECIES: hypothetical protein [unclassified Actinoplanes]AEV82601.1 Major cell-surface adhesin PAc [Actinoplanes sp. SE50/110]ATO80997.1 Major cell-surface adhesin PAc [Actinoplanes sp. SE50]SLL98404.1 hypothetical protein ACSP50_1630 [Actinoplanes sp. SE50/110]
MSLWRRMRGELAGAWRSVKYDLCRRPAEGTEGPDVTSTGLSTFPGSLMEWRTVPPETDARPRRRFVVVVALCALGLVGATGSYLLVTRGLAAAGEQPVAVPAPSPSPSPSARLGTVTGRPRPTATHHRAAPATAVAPISPTKAGISPERAIKPAPRRSPVCHCVTPPVPTPTAAPSSEPAPSPSVPTSASAPPSASAEPAPSTSDDAAPHLHHRW